MNKTLTYVKSILFPVIVGGIVAIIISSFIDYNMLEKPNFAPQSVLFPIVWTLLYILMGVSYGILKSNNLVNNKINSIYLLQLAINALWSIFFFVFEWRLFSFFWIILLDIAIIVMIYRFYQSNKIAGLLQIPYLIWSLFATYLNLSIYLLNR